MKPIIVWFRQDLRLQDNPALHAAISAARAGGCGIIPVYIWDADGEWGWPLGSASRWWLHRSLAALDHSLRERGSRLVLARGDTERELRRLVRESSAGAVYWNRRYELSSVARDSWIEADLADAKIEVKTFNASLLNEPWAIANRQGRPFQVFSPYWRHCLTTGAQPPLRLAAGDLPSPQSWPRTESLDALEIHRGAKRDAAFDATWTPGEVGAVARLKRFVDSAMEDYATARDLPAIEGTSRLSPHLHFGELGPRQIWAAVRKSGAPSGLFPPNRGATIFLNEVGWREFAYHLLFNFPHTAELPLREEFAEFPWAEDLGGEMLVAWQSGQTGYPIVDAGMRQLERTGWMHNRVRMIAASFLVKHLRLSWRAGAAWFWEKLVDADLANNTLGWQWSAGCGADAAPYFRIFAPVLQGEKFDSEGRYIREWVPELGRLPAKYIHAPWTAPAEVLASAEVALGKNYPRPLVDHATARTAALSAFQTMRSHARAGVL